MPARQAGRGLEIFPGARGKMQDLTLGVDHDMRGREAFQDADLGAAPQGGHGVVGLMPQAARRREPARLSEERKPEGRYRGVIATLEDALFLVDRDEQVAMLGDVLRGPEEQVATLPQGEVEHRNDLRLELAAQIDEEVAAGNQIDARERGVASDAVCREYAHLPQALVHHVAAVIG